MEHAVSASIEDGTPTPTRHAQVANLRNRNLSGMYGAVGPSFSRAASMGSERTVLRVSNVNVPDEEATIADTAAAAAAAAAVETEAAREMDYGAKHGTYAGSVTPIKYQERMSMHATGGVVDMSNQYAKGSGGLQLALESTARLPFEHASSTTTKQGGEGVSDRYNVLLSELREAAEAYEAIVTKRDLNDDEADPIRGSNLNLELNRANNRLLHAERAYYACKAEVHELRSLPVLSRANAEVSDSQKARKEAIAEAPTRKHELQGSSADELESLQRQAERDRETIANLRDQVQRVKLDSVRSTLAQRRENTELTGYNRCLSWEAAQLASNLRKAEARLGEVESLNANLHGTLEREREHYKNSQWEPKSVGIGHAYVVSALNRDLRWELDPENELGKITDGDLESVAVEIDKVRKVLEKYGVLKPDKAFV